MTPIYNLPASCLTTMRQIIIAATIVFLLLSCDHQTEKKVSPENHNRTEKESEAQNLESTSNQKGWNYEEVKQNYIDSLMLDICSTSDLEFFDLYPILDSIASDKYENSILVDLLKTKGFKVINWGRGNWMEGPRILNFTLSNQQCECQVDKLYYSTEQERKYKVTERIKCKKASR